VKARTSLRIVVVYNRDFEGAESDPENKAREDVKEIADHIVRILNTNGYDASGLGVTSDVVSAVTELRALKPAAVFNLCESIHGDNRFECLLPLLMELEGIPYTGSGPFALSLALRKEKVKSVLLASGISVPRGVLVSHPGDLASLSLRFPVIVKPAREDASVGITRASVVSDEQALAQRALHILDHYRQPALVEEYIDGREIYVSLLGQVDGGLQIFPFFEIDFSAMPLDRPRIVSFEGKWVEDSVEYKGTRPVRCEGLSPDLHDKVAQTALSAFHSVGLRDYGRMDIRLSADGTPYIIDVNPNCDLSDLAGGFSRAAKTGGLSYKEVILRLVSLALLRRLDETPISITEPASGADLSETRESLPGEKGYVPVGVRRGGAGST
jgi:D-alanine-D-alanine ligase